MTPWTVAHQAPLCMGFHRQEYWSRLTFFTPGDLPSVGKTYSQPPRALICEHTTHTHTQQTHSVLRSSPLISQYIKMGPLNTLALGTLGIPLFLRFFFMQTVYKLRSIQSLSCVRLFVTPWTAARQASLSITNSQSLLQHVH